MNFTATAGSVLGPAELLVVGIAENGALPTDLNECYDGALTTALEDEKFKPTAGTTVAFRGLGRVPAKWVLVVGTGANSPEDERRAAGAAATFARDKGLASMRIEVGNHIEHQVEGIIAGNYRFDQYVPEDDRKATLESVVLVNGSEDGVAAGVALGSARSLCRDLVNGPADDVHPQSMAASAQKLASGRLTVEVWDYDKLKSERMGGIEAVGRGSSRKPTFVHMVYTPNGEAAGEVALVGKGVTFDAGGLSIKPSGGMMDMRCDMGGAGAVVGIMSALEALDIKVKVHGIFGAAENMLGPNAYKLGDVLTFRNGKQAEIHNTDAEGRLVLADCLSYASEIEGVTHIVDLATLTGAAVVALGEHFSACYSNEDGFAKQLCAAADAGGEAYWHMPLEKLYADKLKGDMAPLKNIGDRWAGSITAALFLENFVGEGKTWSHLDIAGPALIAGKERHLCKGATGAGVPGLLAWLRDWA
jgi:leucyl aminopeptidase